MAIANLTEKLLFYTLQKSNISLQLSNIQMDQLSATKSQAAVQLAYNQNLQDLYYDPNVGHDVDLEAYTQYLVQLQNEHEFEMSSLTAWESELENRKESLETQLNEITAYENSWQSFLKSNIQKDFQYGGKGGQ